LVAIHGDAERAILTSDEVTVIKGALDLGHKSVEDAMTPIDQVQMLSYNTILNRKVRETIADGAYSRIPVYGDGGKDDIFGMILVKSLILLNPDEDIPIKNLKIYPIPRVAKNSKLYHLLNVFQEGGSHMAVVTEFGNEYKKNGNETGNGKGNSEKVLGNITLEDVIEELLLEEILDETDLSSYSKFN